MDAPRKRDDEASPSHATAGGISTACAKFIPVAGGASSLAFAVNVMNPKLFAELFTPHDLLVSNCFWFNAHLGVGVHLYHRRHMQHAPPASRVLYSVFGAVLFNFGSVLLWATVKTLLPKNVTFRSFFGVGSGLALLFIGKEYLDFVDDRTLQV